AAVQSYHNAGGMILRGPGHEGGKLHPDDDRVHRLIADTGTKMLPGYRNFVTWKDLYSVYGGEFDWFYGGLGIVSFTNELWTNDNYYRRPLATGDQGDREETEFVRNLLMDDGFSPWKEVDHPTYGKIEV